MTVTQPFRSNQILLAVAVARPLAKKPQPVHAYLPIHSTIPPWETRMVSKEGRNSLVSHIPILRLLA